MKKKEQNEMLKMFNKQVFVNQILCYYYTTKEKKIKKIVCFI